MWKELLSYKRGKDQSLEYISRTTWSIKLNGSRCLKTSSGILVSATFSGRTWEDPIYGSNKFGDFW